MIQLSHPYMTTGKTIALTTWTFVGKVMSLLFKKVKSICLITTLVYQGPYKHTICVPFKFQKLRGWHVIISNRDFKHDMHHNSIFSHTPLLICTVAIILGQTEKWHLSLLLEWLSHAMLNFSSFTGDILWCFVWISPTVNVFPMTFPMD